jgi:hypothetical protein
MRFATSFLCVMFMRGMSVMKSTWYMCASSM